MPLGDSITYGAGSSDSAGYRSRLFHLSLVNYKSLTFVGGKHDGPATVDGVPFPIDHEGFSGYEIAGIAGFAAEQVGYYKPQILLLMIGMNDMAYGDAVTDAPTRLGSLLDLIIATVPNSLIVVSTVTPAIDTVVYDRIRAFNAAIPAVVASRAAAGAHITTVDMFAALAADPKFATTELTDNLHPNDAGYNVIAQTWYDKVGPLLPPLK